MLRMGMDGTDAGPDGLDAGTRLDNVALDEARLGFHRAFPQRSAKRTFYITQILLFALLCAGLYAAWRAMPAVTFNTMHALALALFTSAILWRLFAAASLAPLASQRAAPARWPVYTLLCPLYREANIVGDLLTAIGKLDYPVDALEIILLIEEDDQETLRAARAAIGERVVSILIVPPAQPRTKPKALNAGLARARGEHVVVYDAEDRPHPQQLRAALAAFANGGETLACVQAPLMADNEQASWIAGQFATEYAIQFGQILPLLARLGLPLPLGGSSNHFRTAALRATGGWDPHNVTEDADLGYRLARDGWRSDVIAPPTHEEAPVSFGAWFNQRTRWLKGHMQTWLVLMRDPLRSVREMGLGAFASMQLVLAGGIAAAFVHGPLACILLVAALSPYDLLGPTDFVLALFGYTVAIFSALSAYAQTGNFHHARAAFTMPFYWPLASLAAFRALVELIVRPHHWAKTDHGLSPRADQESERNNAHIVSTSRSF